MPNVAFSTYTYTAGGTTARTTANRAADAISVKEYGCVGDGVTNDSAAWLSAIASGRSLFVPPGTYLLGATTSASPLAGQRINGVPGQSILQRTTAAGTSYVLPFFDIVDVFDVVIDGLTLNEIVPGGFARQYGFYIRTALAAAGNVGRIRIQNCTFKNCPNGIERYVDTVWINNNSFLGGGVNGAQMGVSMGSSPLGNTVNGVCQNIFIQDNYFTQTRQEAIDVNWDVRNVVITGNIIVDVNVDGLGNEAIDMGGGDGTSYCANALIANNIIQYTTASLGIGLRIKQYSQDINVIGNTIVSAQTGGTPAPSGIIVSGPVGRNIVISGNTLRGWPYAIIVDFSAIVPYVANGLVISDNAIEGCGIRGVSVAGQLTQCIVANNKMSTSVATTPQYGIYFTQICSDIVVEGNRVQGFLTAGIFIDNTCSDGTVTGNQVSGCTLGIQIQAPRLAITGNSARACSNNGFNVTAAHLTVTGNHAYNNAQVTANAYGFLFNAGCNYSVIVGNHSYDTQGTPTQNGFSFGGVSDRVIFNNNIAGLVKTTAVNNAVALTNSIVGAAGTGNIQQP